jgi:hypothetical protein
LGERIAKRLLGDDVRPLDIEVIARQLELHELGVIWVVFEENEPQRSSRILVHADMPS